MPSGSDEPDALKLHVSPLHADVNDATGGALAGPMLTVWLALAVLTSAVTYKLTV